MGNKTNYLEDIDKKLEQLRQDLRELEYGSISVYGVIKIPIWMMLRGRYLSPSQTCGNSFIDLCWNIKELGRHLFYKKNYSDNRQYREGKSFIFVLDHDQPGFIKMQLEVMEKFNDESIVIISSDRALFNKLSAHFSRIYCTEDFGKCVNIRFSHFRIIYKIIKRASLLKRENLVFKANFLRAMVKTLKQIDFYSRYLDPDKHRAVVVLSDPHTHENVVTNVARLKGISTFSLQHGLVSKIDTPISSKRIFVWGETTKKELVKYNVPENKIVIAGRPGLNADLKRYLRERKMLRQSYFEKYSNGHEKPIVTFIGGNWGPQEDKRLFEVFLNICDLDILPVIKIKPNLVNKRIALYKKRVNELPYHEKICLQTDSDLYKILSITDILVGFVSSAVVEALPFSVICVILDLFEYVDLKTTLPHYHDCQVVNSSQGLRELVGKIISNPECSTMLKRKSFHSAKKYFHEPLGNDASEYIYSYICRLAKDIGRSVNP